MFHLSGSKRNQNLETAIDQANKLLNEGHLYREINNKVTFDMSTAKADHISKQMMKFRAKEVEVKIYKPLWRWSKAYGYFSYKHPYDINLNYYKLNRSVASFVGTLVHEYIHMVDNLDEKHSYGHGNNSAVGKENTAPYWIGNLAGSMAAKIEPQYTSNENHRYVTSVWSRVKRFLSRLF